MKNLLPLIGMGLLGWWLYNKVNDLSKLLTYQLYSFVITDVSAAGIKGKIVFTIGNGANLNFTVNGIKADILFSGVKIGTINSRQETTIFANTATPVSVDFVMPFTGAANKISLFIQNYLQGLPTILDVRGKLLFDAGSLNISVRKQFSNGLANSTV